MRVIIFYLALPFVYLLSILPFRILYFISDIFYFMLFHILGYRKRIVLENLRKSFPGKNEKELRAIMRKFYRYLCDLFLETFKTLTISREKMLRHCVLTGESHDLFNKLYHEKKSCIIVMGHYGNWEWAGNTFSILCKQQLYVIYHPLKNVRFNNLVIKMRNRFGTRLIQMKDTFREMVSHRNEITATAFIADQTPSPEGAYWMQFLNQETPVFKGTGKIAQKLNYPVIYVSVKRVRRGYYNIYAEELIPEPSGLTEDQITVLHTERLEKDIAARPEFWLWSHRRWKHSKPENLN